MSKTIGLLGGSFNPAHDGHVHISKEALRVIGVDEVWWLVSPQNPLKPVTGMKPFEERYQYASDFVAGETNIKVLDFEKAHGLTYTIDTIGQLVEAYPDHRFVWMMGADNLLIFHHWRYWQEIAQLLPIAVFDRGDAAAKINDSVFIEELASKELKDPKMLLEADPPGWSFLKIDKHPASSTAIREGS